MIKKSDGEMEDEYEMIVLDQHNSSIMTESDPSSIQVRLRVVLNDLPYR